MRPMTIAKAAEHMGYCVQGALKRIKRMQRLHPDIEILLPRAAKEPWRINPIGYKRAVEIDRHSSEADLSHRVGILESETRTVKRKLRRLEICVFGRNNAGMLQDGQTEP